jgi:hypothetical protein
MDRRRTEEGPKKKGPIASASVQTAASLTETVIECIRRPRRFISFRFDSASLRFVRRCTSSVTFSSAAQKAPRSKEGRARLPYPAWPAQRALHSYDLSDNRLIAYCPLSRLSACQLARSPACLLYGACLIARWHALCTPRSSLTLLSSALMSVAACACSTARAAVLAVAASLMTVLVRLVSPVTVLFPQLCVAAPDQKLSGPNLNE